ncbi:SagB family peptide dehydrogenase [Nonomuraea sp. NPDC050310]|uniref:SagB family peptide dehydrogenase n=1 Tax=Nonomuraea sp. NPDC050310 TaxID=3154935 RepID=UPI0033C6D79E
MRATRESTGCVDRVGLRPGAYGAISADGVLHLVTWRRSESFTEGAVWKLAVLRRLAAGPAEPADLAAEAPQHDVAGFVGLLGDRGWLTVTTWSEGRALYTVRPELAPPPAPPGFDGAELVLSRFALMRRAEGLVIESPMAWARVEVHDAEVASFCGALSHAASAGPHGEVSRRVLHDLRRTGLAVPAGDPEPRARLWQPHELWFHHRTRSTVPDLGYRRDLTTPTPQEAAPPRRAAVRLARPDLDRLRRHDPPLAQVMEARRSIRAHDDSAPVTAGQLGELLHRCARVRQATGPGGARHTSRPYPSGGAVYELEVYPVIRLAAGLEPGLYRYDPHDHRLDQVGGPGPEFVRLLHQAARATGSAGPPQVLLVLAARFDRLMARYQDIPYSLILKHAGVLLQTLHLAATAMGLGSCVLGAGEGAAFAAATGLDPTVEGSVGELVLGSLPGAGR